MTDDLTRRAFTPPTTRLVRITRDGFLIEGHPLPELAGRVARTSLLRKLFDDGRLLCHSPDGLHAHNGTPCNHCRHPRCRPHLRLHLAQESTRYILDLPPTSARNLLALEDQALASGLPLHSWTLRLTVRNRGDWGEVAFQRAHPLEPPPPSPSQSPEQSDLPSPRVNLGTAKERDQITPPERGS